jgi:hypothetical protein
MVRIHLPPAVSPCKPAHFGDLIPIALSVNHEFCAGHEAGRVGSEEQHSVRDILHLSSAAEGTPAPAISRGSIDALATVSVAISGYRPRRC